MVRTTAQRWMRFASPYAQQALAAAVAWLVAVRMAGHADPFFAPIAAVVGLNATLGRRGSNAVRLLAGVLIGVLVGEAAFSLAGDGVWTLAGATFTAMLLARAVHDARIVRAQAAVAAILIIVVGQPQHGWDRLLDAVIGSAVALAFSQLLFPPEPLRLLRLAEARVLTRLAAGLRAAAEAVEHGDRPRADDATALLRDVHGDLEALRTARSASDRIVRHGLTWRRRAGLVVTERERADHLDLLAGSCLALTRSVTAVRGPHRARLAATVRHLAAALADLADDPADEVTRQVAAERAADLAASLIEHGDDVRAQSAVAAAYASIRMVAADVMVFAGVDPERSFRDTFPA
ncbi:FUSC family protein [Couchioplanes caeruleus]|uniref:FUSC family protein n=1 Tax=Couchioplanes caeruleus TaxID=56438 RepID=UPI0020C18824|nr:FUSC family protein [Couchioplanes caeruleus]UQU62597.1 FUSC family protein [Couchioplanes caeruleus]